MIALAPTQILLAQATVLGSYQEGHWLKCIPSFSVAAVTRRKKSGMEIIV